MSRLVIELTGVPVLHCTLFEFLSPDEMNQLPRLKMQRFATQFKRESSLFVKKNPKHKGLTFPPIPEQE